MIKVNLLPQGTRRAGGPKLSVEQLPWKKIGLGVLGLLGFVSGLLLLSNALQGSALARLTAEMERLGPEKVRLEQAEVALRSLQSRTAAINALRAPEKQWAPRLNLFADSLVSDLWFTHLMFFVGPSSETQEFISKEFQELGLPDFRLPPGLLPEPQTQPGAAPVVGPNGLPIASSAAPKPFLVLVGSAVVTSKDAEAPVTRFLQRLKEHPEFSRWFKGLEMKDVVHTQIGQEEVSNFVVLLYPTGS